MAAPGDIAAPLRLPAILQNPTSNTQRQVEAHNAQQRERIAARREREKAARSATSADGKLSGKGRRVIRRYDNATFADNPHIALPRRSDLFPPVPLHNRPTRPGGAFPPSTIPRTSSIANAAPPDRNPLSDSSVSGGFSTSLKGVRALLRKGGRRAEVLIPRVEGVMRGWLEGVERVHVGGRYAGAGDGTDGEGEEEHAEREGWSVVDPTLTEVKSSTEAPGQGVASEGNGASTSAATPPLARRLPPTLRPPNPLPPLPVKDGFIPAILEITRSPAHISLAVIDPYDRLIVHLLARYYECLSWSEEYPSPTPSQPPIRLTHIIIPHLLRPKASHRAQMLTPEATDISGQSASEVESGSSDALGSSDDAESSSGAESDATVGGSERGGLERSSGHGRGHASAQHRGKRANGRGGGPAVISDAETSAGLSAGEYDVEGYYLDAATERSFGAGANGDDGTNEPGDIGEETFRADSGADAALRARLARIALEDAAPNGASSSTALRRVGSQDSLHSVHSVRSIDTIGSSHYASSEASEFTTASSVGLGDSMTLPPAQPGGGAGAEETARANGWHASTMAPNGYGGLAASAQRQLNGASLPAMLGAVGQVKARQGWEDRPTFFDYLYGA